MGWTATGTPSGRVVSAEPAAEPGSEEANREPRSDRGVTRAGARGRNRGSAGSGDRGAEWPGWIALRDLALDPERWALSRCGVARAPSRSGNEHGLRDAAPAEVTRCTTAALIGRMLVGRFRGGGSHQPCVRGRVNVRIRSDTKAGKEPVQNRDDDHETHVGSKSSFRPSWGSSAVGETPPVARHSCPDSAMSVERPVIEVVTL